MLKDEDSSGDRSDYSQETLRVANDVFFICEEHENPPDLVDKFEYLREKKYSYWMLRYANYLISPMILGLVTDPEKRLEQVIKSFSMIMMIQLKGSAAHDGDTEDFLLKLSPKMFHYQTNSRNKRAIKGWNNPGQEGDMPRILKKLIHSEAAAFLKEYASRGYPWYWWDSLADWNEYVENEKINSDAKGNI